MKCLTVVEYGKIEAGKGQVVRPHYDTLEYREFVKQEKAKGLQRRSWKNLPKMWQDELRFRRELEKALKSFANGKV